MKRSLAVSLLLNLSIRLPIWYFLVYTMLAAAHPDRLVWFLFYAYIPLGVFDLILSFIVEQDMRKTEKKSL